MEFLFMYETTNQKIEDKLLHISHNPWLYDDNLDDQDRMMWKLKNICHLCHIDPTFHRDDCGYSLPQLMMSGALSGLMHMINTDYPNNYKKSKK